MPRITDARIIQALMATQGLVTLAARNLGVEPGAVWRRAENSPRIAAAINDAREHAVDVAELMLLQACKQGESWAIRFFLQTQGRDRGYAPRTDDSTTDEPLSEHELAEMEQRLGITPPQWELPNRVQKPSEPE